MQLGNCTENRIVFTVMVFQHDVQFSISLSIAVQFSVFLSHCLIFSVVFQSFLQKNDTRSHCIWEPTVFSVNFKSQIHFLYMYFADASEDMKVGWPSWWPC